MSGNLRDPLGPVAGQHATRDAWLALLRGVALAYAIMIPLSALTGVALVLLLRAG